MQSGMVMLILKSIAILAFCKPCTISGVREIKQHYHDDEGMREILRAGKED